jgi:hypothetical protein
MTSASSHVPEIPAELRKSPPREIRLKRGAVSKNMGQYPLFYLMACLCVVFLIYDIAGLVFWAVGPVVTGRIVEKTTHKTLKGNNYCEIIYRFGTGGEIRTNKEEVSDSFYDSARQGSDVPVNAIAIGSHRFDEIHMPAGEYFYEHGVLWLPVVFVGVFIVGTTSGSRFFEGGLVRHGQPTIGTIEQKWKRGMSVGNRSKGGMRYVVVYRFEDAQNRLWTGQRMNVTTQVEYERLLEGERVVLLFNPSRPRRNLIYRCGAYKAV